MSAVWPVPAASEDDRILVMSRPIRAVLHRLVLQEAKRVEKAAALCRKHDVTPRTSLARQAADLRALAAELAS